MKAYECCPYCEAENEYDIKLGMVQKCKTCGEYIILCSLCDDVPLTNCSECKYEKEIKRLKEIERNV